MNSQSARATLATSARSAGKSSAKPWVLIVGYDGSPAAGRALEQAIEMLKRRDGVMEIVYVASLPIGAYLNGEALAAVVQGLDERTAALAGDVRARLSQEDHVWHFRRRDGVVPSELLRMATDLDHHYCGSAEIIIVVGGATHWYHHLAGSVASSVVRADHFPVMIVP